MANDTAVGIAASQGNFQLNVFLPVTVYNVLQSIRLLSDGMVSFNDNCAAGIRPNRDKIKQNLERSLMLVTALSPRIGYDNAAAVAKKAYEEGITLKEAAVRLGLLTESEFDQLWIRLYGLTVWPMHGNWQNMPPAGLKRSTRPERCNRVKEINRAQKA